MQVGRQEDVTLYCEVCGKRYYGSADVREELCPDCERYIGHISEMQGKKLRSLRNELACDLRCDSCSQSPCELNEHGFMIVNI